MARPQPAGEPHAAFTRWAEEQGVQINGIEPARIPGRGVGMVATRDIHVFNHHSKELPGARR